VCKTITYFNSNIELGKGLYVEIKIKREDISLPFFLFLLQESCMAQG